jgi:hypothetical protein
MPSKTRKIQSDAIPVLELGDGTIEVKFSNGDVYTLREPKVRQFIKLDSWVKDENVPADLKSEAGVPLYIFHLSVRKKNGKPFDEDFIDWVDVLEIRDMEVVGAALATFQSLLEYLQSRGNSN